MSTNVGEIDLSLILNSDQFRNQLKNLPKETDKAANMISSSLGKIGRVVATVFSVAKILQFGKTCVDVATETANAWIGLNSILVGQGKSFNKAKEFINSYISDGLIPLNDAVTAYKNLASRGYNTEQIQNTMEALKNASVYGRQSNYTMGEAVRTATEGLKNENSILVDNAGVTKNVAKMWEEYAKSIGKTRDSLTQQEKIQAEYTGILKETQFQMHDAETVQATFTGKVAVLSQAFTNMKIAIGNVIQPIAKLFIPMLTAATNAVTRLFTALAGLLSLFGLKADSVETVSSGLEGVAENADKASGALDKAGNSVSKSGKKAKGALASWDELNVLSNSDSSGSGGGASGGGTIEDSFDVKSTVEEDTSVFDGLIARLKELANIFKEGFLASWGDTNFDGITNHLNHIKSVVKDIFTDPDVLYSANQWVDTTLYALGQMTGAIARIGKNIVEFLVGSIDYYLTQNVDRIKGFLCNMFDIYSERATIVGNFAQVLGEISDVFSSDIAKQIGADIIAIFANPWMSLKEFGAKWDRDIDKLFMQPIIDNVSKIKTALENTLAPIQTITGEISQSFTNLGDSLNQVYDEKIKPMFDSLTAGLSDTFSKFLDVYNSYIAPVLQAMADKFADVWDSKIHPMLVNFIGLIGDLAECVKVLWETVLKPTIDWIVTNVVPVITNTIQVLWDSLTEFFGYVSDIINGIIEVLRGILDFIIGVFTGDWQRAWDGIKAIFVGIWNTMKAIFMTIVQGIVSIILALVAEVELRFTLLAGIVKAILQALATVISNIWTGIKNFISKTIDAIKSVVSSGLNAVKNTFSNIFNGIWNIVKSICNSILGGIEKMVNGVINGLNNMINALNSLSFTVPDWVPELGGKSFGFNIPNIGNVALPRLAQGGYVKANSPQLAVVGDNRTQGEIISPENKMYEVMTQALESFFEKFLSIMPSNDDKPIIVQLVLDGDFTALAQALKPYIDEENTRRGVKLVVGGAK